MGEIQPASKVAKDLGIYLGQIYGYHKRGLVKNHLVGGYPEGKGMTVDPDEVKAAWMGSKKKGPRDPSKKRASKRANGGADVGSEPAEPRTRKLKAGTIVSYENGRSAGAHEAGKPRYTVAQVLSSTGRLTFLDDGDHRRHYEGTQIDNTVFGTERLSTMLAKGVVRIEHPAPVLGMVILSLILENKVAVAESLEKWMEKNGLEVVIPEIIDLEDEDDEPEPVRSAPILAGADDDDDE